ncbi:MAG TPA: hypothetical protein DCE41_11475 [Cytophagales bacterium]|nr:hypothetical protein [Cytophagales bacterium]
MAGFCVSGGIEVIGLQCQTPNEGLMIEMGKASLDFIMSIYPWYLHFPKVPPKFWWMSRQMGGTYSSIQNRQLYNSSQKRHTVTILEIRVYHF